MLNFSGRYTASRYTNFVNTEETSGYAIYAAYIDLGGGFSVGPLKEVKLRLNVDNLFDKDYLGTISPTTNTLATFRPGPPRTFQVSLVADF